MQDVNKEFHKTIDWDISHNATKKISKRVDDNIFNEIQKQTRCKIPGTVPDIEPDGPYGLVMFKLIGLPLVQRLHEEPRGLSTKWTVRQMMTLVRLLFKS